MKGSVFFDKRMKRYCVLWYDKAIRRTRQIWTYKGFKLETKEMADKLLRSMQGDYENGCFRIEKFINNETDVALYLRSWLETIKPNLSPATYKDYKNSIEKHIIPFFATKTLMLHEIGYDTLVQLKNSIKRSGKGQFNVINCLRAGLGYAWKSGRIHTMPAFPEKKTYNIVDPVIKWLPSDRQEAVIGAIPEEHQPIFWWLKYHLRRPSEACALLKEDYKDGIFCVCRGFSARVVHNRTKTGEKHLVPAVSAFADHIEHEQDKQRREGILSPYFFVNPKSKNKDRHYTVDFLADTWREACRAVGENIQLYSGTKHSTASQMMNEQGYTLDEIQIAGDWKNRESVKKYAKVEVSARKNLLEGKVVKLISKKKVGE